MIYLLCIPFLVQGILIAVDEIYFHHRRKLGRWESVGHPLDTLTLVACFAWTLSKPYDASNLRYFIALGVFSSIFIFKDEWIHWRECRRGEIWIHVGLFLVHPIVLVCLGLIWKIGPHFRWILEWQLVLLIIYMIYQILYWNFWKRTQDINNHFYDDLGERWYEAQDEPIALLRAQSKLFVEWIDLELRKNFDPRHARILDVACGAGLVANLLALRGWKITAIDLSTQSLAVARRYDSTQSVDYQPMDALALHFPQSYFDAVISLDMLEHVEDPGRVILESSRVLKNGGAFFFHTFNRTWLGWLFAVKGIEWVFRNSTAHIHVLRLFIRPNELATFCKNAGLSIASLRGVSPKFSRKTWLPLLCGGKVVKDFEFQFTANTAIGYAGSAIKQN